MKGPDTAFRQWQCGVASCNDNRFAEAETHFLRAIELADRAGRDSMLANALIAYAGLLVKLRRPQEAIAMYERRLALKRFRNEDRLERRCTAELLVELKEKIGV